MVIGANPTDGHPVFGSRMKKRIRAGAKLIVVDPRKTDSVKSPHVKAAVHLPLMPGTNVAIVNAMAHTIITEGLENKSFIAERCDGHDFKLWVDFISDKRNSPEVLGLVAGVDAEDIRKAARSMPRAAMRPSIMASA